MIKNLWIYTVTFQKNKRKSRCLSVQAHGPMSRDPEGTLHYHSSHVCGPSPAAFSFMDKKTQEFARFADKLLIRIFQLKPPL